MRRETQNVLLVLLGGALLKISWTEDYLRYVKPSLLPFLLAAGGVVLTLALLAIGRDVLAGHPVGHDDHDHAGRSPWLLVLPVLAIFLVAPPALGADTVTRSAGSVAAADGSGADFRPLPPGDAPPLRLTDFVTRAVWDDSDSLAGRAVRLTGFVVHGQDGSTSLAQLSMSCCAADATPVQVRLSGPTARLAALPQDAWFEVRAQLEPDSATSENRFVPTVTVLALRPLPTPERPYEY